MNRPATPRRQPPALVTTHYAAATITTAVELSRHTLQIEVIGSRTADDEPELLLRLFKSSEEAVSGESQIGRLTLCGDGDIQAGLTALRGALERADEAMRFADAQWSVRSIDAPPSKGSPTTEGVEAVDA